MTFEEFINQNPLTTFSTYTHLQACAVIELGNSIKQHFDEIIKDDNVVDMSTGDLYGSIWLWVIGAYEVVRTMSDPTWKASWEKSKYLEIVSFKKRLANLRVPFAKQEHRNKKKAINAENSIYGIDSDRKSYLFEVKGKVFNIRDEIDSFENLIESIRPENVLHDLRDNDN